MEIQRLLLDLLATTDLDYNQVIGEVNIILAQKHSQVLRIRRQYQNIPAVLQPINKKLVLDIHFLLNFISNYSDYMLKRNNAEFRV